MTPREATKQLLKEKYIPELFGSKEEVIFTSADTNEYLTNLINYVSSKDESNIK